MMIELARKVSEQENLIDRMERKYRKNHIIRVNEGRMYWTSWY